MRLLLPLLLLATLASLLVEARSHAKRHAVHPDNSVPGTVQPFLNKIFETFGTDNMISQVQFRTLFVKLGLVKEKKTCCGGHNHDDEGHHDDGEEKHGSAGGCCGGKGEPAVEPVKEEKHVHGEGCCHGTKKPETESDKQVEEERDHGKKKHEKRHLDHGSSVDYTNQCLSPGKLTEVFGLPAGSDIDRQHFLQMSPALIHMAASNVCAPKKTAKVNENLYEAWGGAMLANILVTLLALLGALLIPLLRKKNATSQVVMTFFMALAVGSLLGDAILHLIPEAMGVHTHDDPNPDEKHDHHQFVWVGSITVLGVYSFFLLEKFLHHVSAKKAESTESKVDIAKSGEVKPIVWLVVVGDGLHNFVDGLAIGCAFLVSTPSGIKTSIAVLLHEIPHEIGDFAVLLSSGLSIRKALFFNCLHQLPAFLGSVLALTAFNKESNAKMWILAFTAGNFLYVALADLLPSLFGGHSHSDSHSHGHGHNHGHQEKEEHSDCHSSTGTTVEEGEGVGEGIFRKSRKDSLGNAIAIHLGVIIGWAAMVLIAHAE